MRLGFIFGLIFWLVVPFLCGVILLQAIIKWYRKGYAIDISDGVGGISWCYRDKNPRMFYVSFITSIIFGFLLIGISVFLLFALVYFK